MSYYEINQQHEVIIPTTNWFEQRVIAVTSESNAAHIISSLQERFKELQDKCIELKKEYETTEDKIRLAGKISRTKHYITNAKAIGDYASILEPLDKMEQEIAKVVDKNIQQKEELLAQANELLNTTDWKTATEKLREIQAEYKKLPNVPDIKNDEIKEKFEQLKDDFFKKKQQSFEDFEQQLLDNLAKKIEFCEEAERLQNSEEWKKTTDKFNDLFERWKQVGVIPKHRAEELWFRFSTAKDIFYTRKKEHYTDVKKEQGENLIKKKELIARAQALKESTQWTKTANEYKTLMEEWKNSGRVGHEMNDAIWNEFLEARNYFFTRKDNHFSEQKIQLEDNYARKMAIVIRAEELKNTIDFEHATHEYAEMMNEWKTIGRTAKEHGDEAWDRFIAARKEFFERKDEDRENRKSTMAKELQEKIARNRNYLSKLNRELRREEDAMYEFEDRIKNLPATLRSYEKREQYQEILADVKKKVTQLTEKYNEVKNETTKYEREYYHITKPAIKQKQNPKNTDEKLTLKEVKTILNDTDENNMTTDLQPNEE